MMAITVAALFCACHPDKAPTMQMSADDRGVPRYVGAPPSGPSTAVSSNHDVATARSSRDGGGGVSSVVADSSISVANVATPMATTEYHLKGTRLNLGVESDRCTLSVDDGTTKTLHLDLEPPCYLLLWNHPPPRLPNGRAESGGQPIGAEGEPMAWKYATAGGATVIAVIGDAVPESMKDSVFKTRRAHGYRCAGSFQGVSVRPSGPTTASPKRQPGVICAESDLDEKDFWMMAHDKPR